MNEPTITLPVSQYNALVRQARDQKAYVEQERIALAAFVNDLADRASVTYRNPLTGGGVSEVLRAGLSMYLRSEGELPVAVEV